MEKTKIELIGECRNHFLEHGVLPEGICNIAQAICWGAILSGMIPPEFIVVRNALLEVSSTILRNWEMHPETSTLEELNNAIVNDENKN